MGGFMPGEMEKFSVGLKADEDKLVDKYRPKREEERTEKASLYLWLKPYTLHKHAHTKDSVGIQNTVVV